MLQIKNAKISVFTLVMLNVAAVMSLRGLPMMADTGTQLIFYVLFSAILFLIPSGLVSAELAAAWPGQGGVYRWVKMAFGRRAGFCAVWLQWSQNIFYYPTLLAFSAAAFAGIFNDPKLSDSNYYTAAFIIIVYWLATFITFRGLSFASKVATWGVLLGTMLPGVVVILGGAWWWLTGHPLAFEEAAMRYIPDVTKMANISFLAGIVLLFAGMEVGAVHVKEMKDPQREFPKAMLTSVAIIIVVFLVGAFSVAAVIPVKDLSLTAGLMQTFDTIFSAMHVHFLFPVICFLIAFGSLAGVLAWLSGPSKALLVTARDGEIPPFLAHTNKHGIQTHILLVQAVIITILASLYIFMKDVSTAFFILSAMTVSLYLVMYILMFAAAIRLRYKFPEVPRPYRVGRKGNGLMWIVGGLGFLVVVYAFALSFVPPVELKFGTPMLYTGLVLAGLVIFIGAANIIHSFRKDEWIKESIAEHPEVPINVDQN